MPVRVNLAYQYDGSFEGFLSCVFESFEKNEIPSAIFGKEPEQLSFRPVRFVETDQSRALRVLASIPKKISPRAQEIIQICFLSNHPQKEHSPQEFCFAGHSAPLLRSIPERVVFYLRRNA